MPLAVVLARFIVHDSTVRPASRCALLSMTTGKRISSDSPPPNIDTSGSELSVCRPSQQGCARSGTSSNFGAAVSRAAILVQLYLNDYIEQLMRLRYHFADFGWSKVDGLDVVACKCAFVCLVRLIQHIASPAADFDPLRNPLH